MQGVLDKANAFFERPLPLRSRLLIVVGVLVVIPAFLFPLWKMSFYSNQYTDGLNLEIYAYKLEGGKTANRDDLREINSLNHYIGMRPLLESDFAEFAWVPLCIGVLMLLALRAAVMGRMAYVIDVFVLFSYFGLYSLWSFYYRLYTYGHNLDPTASITVEPFTPPVFGTKEIANFTVQSYPAAAAYALAGFSVFLLLAILLARKPAGPATVEASDGGDAPARAGDTLA